MAKMNCWDFSRCGREAGGVKEHEKGVCPAAIEVRLNGKNHGINGGRACWVVSGTLCDVEQHEDFVNKLQRCKTCAFYLRVHEEEGADTEKLMDLFGCIMDLDGDIR